MTNHAEPLAGNIKDLNKKKFAYLKHLKGLNPDKYFNSDSLFFHYANQSQI